jgi:hypothetical protein
LSSVTKSLREQEAEQELFSDQQAHKPNPIRRVVFHFLIVMLLLAVFAILVAHDPGVANVLDDNGNYDYPVNYFEAFYFSIVTATTVGYGDYSPVTQRGRLLAIFFIPFAVGAMGHFLSSVAEAIMDRRLQSVRVQLASRELSAEDLEIMDTDGDGKVSRAEFLELMLVAMNIVDKEFIDELRQHFGRLDVDGTGILSKEDLVHVARGKLQRIQRKLQLASYKQELLAKATSGRRLQHARRGGGMTTKWNSAFRSVRQTFSLERISTSVWNLGGSRPCCDDHDDDDHDLSLHRKEGSWNLNAVMEDDEDEEDPSTTFEDDVLLFLEKTQDHSA